jgi:hypothetical protein
MQVQTQDSRQFDYIDPYKRPATITMTKLGDQRVKTEED